MNKLVAAVLSIGAVTVGAFYTAWLGWLHGASRPTTLLLLVGIALAASGGAAVFDRWYALTAGAVVLGAVAMANAVGAVNGAWALNLGGDPGQLSRIVFIAISMAVGTTLGVVAGGLVGGGAALVAAAFKRPLRSTIAPAAVIGAAVAAAVDVRLLLHDGAFRMWARSTVYHVAAPLAMQIAAAWSVCLAAAMASIAVIAARRVVADAGRKRAFVALASAFVMILLAIAPVADALANLGRSPLTVTFSHAQETLTLRVHDEGGVAMGRFLWRTER
jgi:hypothetical protein